ncbi:MAG: (2Fe-2S)-binding protein [Rhodospirillaceae bacterium]|nr:(2Fe-2S)-binding protein [Rhodospirillaceae bacterium]
MTGRHRLDPPFGRHIDRERPVRFHFEGRRYEGLAGDTVASALWANGMRVLARSFKYHRPRGPRSFAGAEADTLVQLPGRPNIPADGLPITEGLEVTAQNCAGGLERDRGARLARFARFMPVGFYYKAFYRPSGAWDWWEKTFRRMTGLGRVDPDTPHAGHDKQYLFADVAVIGGGLAGMSAALAAADSGADVLLVDDQPGLGGAMAYTGRQGEAAALAGEVAARVEIRVLAPASCSGWFADHWLAVVAGRRLYKVRAKATVVATGAIEQPMVFANNDLPGVLLGSGAQRLIHLYGVRPGTRAVVVTGNDQGYAVAADLAAAGVEVAALADLRGAGDRPPVPDGARVHAGHTVVEALPLAGNWGVAAAVLAPVIAQGQAGTPLPPVDCDLVVTSVGVMPAAHLLCHSGMRLGYDDDLAMLTLGDLPDGLFAAGKVANSFDPAAVAAEAKRIGWQAAAHAGHKTGRMPRAPKDPGAAGINHPFPYFPQPQGHDFVDLDEDQQTADIANALADGFDHVELLKRYTTIGMGPSQGRHSQLATLRLVAHAKGCQPAEVGLTTLRPPAVPETMGVLAGRGFEPERLTQLHHRHLDAGAQMMPAGVWWRPAYYAAPDRRDEAIREEALAIRRRVGLIDVSTLGGIEVRGPDAAEFLERIYTFAYARQPVGRSRYVLMCDQTGAIVDDGVACRLAERHFYVTATTTGADGVYRQMLWWNAQWRLSVDIANVTAAYCGINIAGPKSRAVLAPLVPGLELSGEAFPYMGVREAEVAGIPCRILRVGFVGELGYELHAPAGCGEALWDALMAAGQAAGIRPVGIEAQRILRLEKGHIIVGQDTDSLTFPQEADMAWAIARKKPFFVGGRSIEILAARPLTRKLVGFTLLAHAPMPQECELVIQGTGIVGRVTSVARSPVLGRIIGLAYVAPDDAAPGRTIHLKVSGRYVEAEVVALPFYDPDNTRQSL